ncbi:MAG: PQQ-dependent sugar dehydrogenase [Planctomycetota bacterium]
MKRLPWLLATLALAGCGGRAATPKPTGPPAEVAGWKAVTVARGIRHPWGLAWLPDGRALVTSRDDAAVYLYDDGRFTPIPADGLPEVFTAGQGGLLDIAVHPDDTALPVRVYLTLSTGTRAANRTILVRGVFDGRHLGTLETLFRTVRDKRGAQHFGSRLLWLPDETLLMSIGDGGNPPLRVGGMLAREQAQNLRSHLGSVVRLTADGTAAPDNPFVGRDDALPEIWTYGHRNIQGLARDPASGRIWATEHGPLGGDEVNVLQRGGNYGWPRQTQGRDYRTGRPIGRPNVEGTIDPKVVWTPVQAPSGLVFYTGTEFPDWRNSLFSGGLRAQDIRRLALDGDGNVTGQQRLVIGRRVRLVTQGPDGRLYALTDEEDGRLLRIEKE